MSSTSRRAYCQSDPLRPCGYRPANGPILPGTRNPCPSTDSLNFFVGCRRGCGSRSPAMCSRGRTGRKAHPRSAPGSRSRDTETRSACRYRTRALATPHNAPDRASVGPSVLQSAEISRRSFDESFYRLRTSVFSFEGCEFFGSWRQTQSDRSRVAAGWLSGQRRAEGFSPASSRRARMCRSISFRGQDRIFDRAERLRVRNRLPQPEFGLCVVSRSNSSRSVRRAVGAASSRPRGSHVDPTNERRDVFRQGACLSAASHTIHSAPLRTSRLPSASPGTIAGPESPPLQLPLPDCPAAASLRQSLRLHAVTLITVLRQQRSNFFLKELKLLLRRLLVLAVSFVAETGKQDGH